MNTPTNTSGVIAAAANAQPPVATKGQTPSQALNRLLDNAAIQKQINDATNGNARIFSASLLNIFNDDSKLQQCDIKPLLIEALKSALINLPIEKSLGFAYVIARYNSKQKRFVPQFQIGYKGLIQLCLRTKAYRYINADVVYEGEFKGADKLSGRIDLSGEKISDKIIGYFAYIEELSGFNKAVYWSKEKVMAHAQTYSPSKDKSGKLVGPWVTNFDEMAMKTVLNALIKRYAIMSPELEKALKMETSAGSTEITIDAQAVDNNTPVITSKAVDIPSEIADTAPEQEENAPPAEPPLAPDDYPFKE